MDLKNKSPHFKEKVITSIIVTALTTIILFLFGPSYIYFTNIQEFLYPFADNIPYIVMTMLFFIIIFSGIFISLKYSIFKWVAERDFWAGLRVRANEFNEDDLMALEKAVEQTVRVSLDELGLDPDDLKPITDLDSDRLI